MEHFAQFYYDGGGFMHLVSLSFLAALACSVAGLCRLRRGEKATQLGIQTLALARSLRAFCLGLGFFGSLLLVTSVLRGAVSAGTESALRHFSMSMHPLIWSLLLLCPLSLVVAIRGYSHLRNAGEFA